MAEKLLMVACFTVVGILIGVTALAIWWVFPYIDWSR